MKRKKASVLTACVAVNSLTYFFILPYAQRTANSHMDEGPFFGALLCSISVLLILLGLNNLVQKKDYQLFFLLLVFALTLTYWGYELCTLMCLGCLNSG